MKIANQCPVKYRNFGYWPHELDDNTGHTRPAHLLLDKYWPIFSWLFHSSLCRAKTFPSLIKDRLWLSESLAGQSEAMSRKNLEG